MKTKITLVMVAMLALTFTSCKSYKKTKSGLVYKIFPGNSTSKDSAAKPGNVVKFNFIRKYNDSVLYSSFGKMPSYIPLQNNPGMAYSPLEVFFIAKKGDSIITVESVDTLLKKGLGSQLPPNAKKGDRMTTYIKILEIFKTDSLAMPDYQAEMLKDKPRQEKEAKEMEEKAVAETKIQAEKEWNELKKSGEMDNGIKYIQTVLAGKKITAQKTDDGTFVVVKEKGNGEAAVNGKFISVKYTGKIFETDSVFESNKYTFKMGTYSVIRGWDDGLKLFNKGGKGTLYVPGYLAYGKRPGPGGKINQALTFDVELVDVSDNAPQPETAPAPLPPADNAKTKKPKKG